MQNIRSVNTKVEILIQNALKSNGYFFWKQVKRMIGKPDFYLPKNKLIIFIDSDFWHYNPQTFKFPKSNLIYWKPKIYTNIIRDLKVTSELTKKSYNIIRLWESFILSNRKILPEILNNFILEALIDDNMNKFYIKQIENQLFIYLENCRENFNYEKTQKA